jgi:Cu-processing system permease protein
MATFIIARLTLKEAVRRRILLAALALGVVFLLLYGIGYYFMASQVRFGPEDLVAELYQKGFSNFMALAGIYAVNFLAIAMGALLAADTLAGEIGSGTIQAIVTKPIRRGEIVLGKWLGFALLLALYVVLMVGGVLAVSFLFSGYVLPNMWSGLALIYLEMLLVMTVTLALSSTLPTLATGGVVFGLYGVAFLGGWVEQFGSFLQNPTAIDVGIISSLIIPSEALWRRAAFEMTPSIAQVLGFNFSGPFLTLSVPSDLMIAYAGVYIVVAFAFAVRQFSRKDL